MPNYCFVRVANQGMAKEHFDELCDKLSKNRGWSSDYRLIKDFNGIPFWHSYPRLEGDLCLLRACYEDVKDIVRKFEGEKGYETECVKVEYKHTVNDK